MEEYNIRLFYFFSLSLSNITVVFISNFKKRSRRLPYHLFYLSISFPNRIFSRGILHYFCLLLEFARKRKNTIFRTYRWWSRAEKRKEEIENLLFTRSFSFPVPSFTEFTVAMFVSTNEMLPPLFRLFIIRRRRPVVFSRTVIKLDVPSYRVYQHENIESYVYSPKWL